MESRDSEESHFMKKDLAKTILSQIREDEIVAMCCDVPWLMAGSLQPQSAQRQVICATSKRAA